MRIISGSAGGVVLKAPKGLAVRPTPDLVRQAVFNSLGARVARARVLELFAGTGALSLECLSRGAASALCVEKSARHAQFIRLNLEQARLPAASLRILPQDAFAAIRHLAGDRQQFDLILADPPYGEKNIGRRSTSFAQQLLDDRALGGLVAEGGIFVLGHTKRDTLSIPPEWKETKMLKHGDTVMRFLRVAAVSGSSP
ncbi:MAG TPA: RsmD family RNA methyltransferase [Verrucomicrobiae bacterium]|jgi:16S rRNA (guanine966-N2)-methyltransferase